MDGEESNVNRWVVRLLKLGVCALALIIVGWYAMQLRPPSRPPAKSPAQLLAVLRDRDEKALTRRIAADAIDEADAAVASELTAELSGGDAVGRELAALVLGRLDAEDEGAVDALIAALDDPEQAVHAQAASSLFAVLRKLGDARVRRLRELLVHADADIRRRSVIELGRGRAGETERLDALRGALKDSDSRIRAEAYAGLARHAAISPDDLIAALHDGDPLVQSAACTLLGRMGGEAQPATEALAQLVASNGAAAWSAGQALLQIGPDDPQTLSLLAPLIDSDDRWSVQSAAKLFLQLGRANDVVRQRLLARVDDPREYVADSALDALHATGLEGSLRPPELIDALEKAGDGVLSLVLHHEEISYDRLHGMAFYYPTRQVGFGITDRDLARLGGLHHLRLLDLSANPVGDAGMESIAGLENLEWLFLYDAQVTSAGLAHLAGMTRLRSLALGGCEITDDGLLQLEKLPALEALDLRKTQVTDAGMRRLAGCRRLKAIWLDETQVTDAGLAQLAELPLLEDVGYLKKQFTLRGLAQLKGLATLRPAIESVTDDDLALLTDMPRLRELILSNSGVTDAGLEHIGKLTQLESLSLGGTKITDTGLLKLRSLVNLKFLYLPENSRTGPGFAAIQQSGVTDAGRKALEQVLPKLAFPLVRGNAQFSTMNPAYEVVGLKSEDEADTLPSVP